MQQPYWTKFEVDQLCGLSISAFYEQFYETCCLYIGKVLTAGECVAETEGKKTQTKNSVA
jgi:hypothetical protein